MTREDKHELNNRIERLVKECRTNTEIYIKNNPAHKEEAKLHLNIELATLQKVLYEIKDIPVTD